MGKKEPLYPHVPKGTVPRGVYRPVDIEKERLAERAMGYRAFSLKEVVPIIGHLEVAMGQCYDAVEKLEGLERAAPDESTRRTVRSLIDKVKEICPKIGPLYEESKLLAQI